MQVSNSLAYAAPGIAGKYKFSFYSPDAAIAIIQVDILEYFHLTEADLFKKHCKGDKALPKQIFTYLLCKNGIRLRQIQALFGLKDHSTIIYSRDVIIGYLAPKGQASIKEQITTFLVRYGYTDAPKPTVKTFIQPKGGTHEKVSNETG